MGRNLELGVESVSRILFMCHYQHILRIRSISFFHSFRISHLSLRKHSQIALHQSVNILFIDDALDLADTGESNSETFDAEIVRCAFVYYFVRIDIRLQSGPDMNNLVGFI